LYESIFTNTKYRITPTLQFNEDIQNQLTEELSQKILWEGNVKSAIQHRQSLLDSVGLPAQTTLVLLCSAYL
jgi:hypothetical protein